MSFGLIIYVGLMHFQHIICVGENLEALNKKTCVGLVLCTGLLSYKFALICVSAVLMLV